MSMETIQNAFYQNEAPFSTWTFYSLLITHSQALAPACSALVLYLEVFESNKPSDWLHHIV